METQEKIALGLGAGILGLLGYTILKKPPVIPLAPGYPKTISRGMYSFTVNNLTEETQMKDFLGIDPPGVDIDSYLSGLSIAQLDEWNTYWITTWSSLLRWNIVKFVQNMYAKYSVPAPPGYPKPISRGIYSLIVNNIQEEIQAKDMLGIDPPGVDIDSYLTGLTPEQLEQWKDYWVKIWIDLKRTDIFAFVGQMYNKYKVVIPPSEYPKTISRGMYSFTVNNLTEETQMKDFLGIDPPGVDIDSYLSGLTNAQLGEWKSYWEGIWSGFPRVDLLVFVNQMYNKYISAPPVGYPKIISRGAYSFTVNTLMEESQMNDFLGIDPPGVDIDTYLSGLTSQQLEDWTTYWTKIWMNLGRDDMTLFVVDMQAKYTEQPPPGGLPVKVITQDRETGKRIAGVRVDICKFSWLSRPPILVSVTTNANGEANVQLEYTKYSVFARALPGYGETRFTVYPGTITAGSMTLRLSPPEEVPTGPFTLTIHVQDWDTEGGISGASVTVDGQTGSTSGSGDARFELMEGYYDAEINKGGYETETQSIHISTSDKIYIIDMKKSGVAPPPPDRPTGSIEVTVLDSRNDNPISNMTVVFDQAVTGYNRSFTTDSRGKATSDPMASGEYAKIRANPGAYNGYTDSGYIQVSVLPDMTIQRTIRLNIT